MGICRGRSLRAVLAGSLVFGTVVVGSLIVGAVPTSATTPTVVNCTTGGNFQTAITAAAPGSTIVVHGTCTGNFTISENLTLQGSGTLSGTGFNGPVLTINSGTVSVNNLTIKNGDNTVSGHWWWHPQRVRPLSLTNSTISGNSILKKKKKKK